MIETQTILQAQPLASARHHEVRLRGPRLPEPPTLLARLQRRLRAMRKPAGAPANAPCWC